MDRDQLRNFYFSSSSNYNKFQTSKRAQTPAGRTSNTSVSESAAPATDVSTSQVNISMPSTIHDESTAAPATSANVSVAAAGTSPTEGQPKAGGGFHAARNLANKPATKPTRNAAKLVPDAASAEYFKFLKQQQEMQKHHNALEEAIASLEDSRRSRQSDLTKGRRQALELLRDIEASSDWKLKSKYGLQQLQKDSGLTLELVELYEDVKPQYVAVTQMGGTFRRLNDTYSQKEQYAPHKLFVDQGMRRMGLLEKALAEGNADSTSIARVPDSLLVHVENVCQLPTVDSLIVQNEEAIERLTFSVEQAREKRAAAVSDGEVHVAEKLCYDILEEHERILQEVIAKARTLETTIHENKVLAKVGEEFYEKTKPEFEKFRVKAAKLKTRCEKDIEKMFALREKVEEVEAQTAKKVVEDRVKSDKVLVENADKLESVFVKMEALEREVEVLERERHREIQRRLVEKDKDEHRRAEYARFCEIVDEHLKPLERTIKNVDINLHAAEVLQEMVDNGFSSVREDLIEREKLLVDIKLGSHKQHLEVFRGLVVELGEIIYKKERMVEETDKKVQAAHVQQEILAETFNPDAKKFGDVKKRLLLNRDELEEDVQDLKDRAGSAVDAFTYSSEALEEAGVSYVHPLTEQEHRTLAMKAKMIEFKAMVAGHPNGQGHLMTEIEELKHEINDTNQTIEVTNLDTTGTMGKALPTIAAATKARRVA